MKFFIILIFIVWCHRGEAFFKDLIPKPKDLGDLIPKPKDLGDLIPKPKDLGDLIPKPKDLGDLIPKVINPLNLVFQNKCIEDIGCFYTGPPFYHPIYRPVSLTPSSNIKVHFELFTASNPNKAEQIDTTAKSIKESSFDSKSPLKVLIHGFRVDLEENDVRYQMKDAFINLDKYNVIIVDWTENNGPPYPQAVANARAVGAKLAKLLKEIMKTTGLKAQDIHLIGHSLGGQVSGWTGERIPKLGRITGLDPAGPYFQSADKEVRLDDTDAEFVDVIHTDGGDNFIDGLGLSEPIGHMDFYPNGGNRQPGCAFTSENENIFGVFINTTSKVFSTVCSHTRANSYFLESIDNSHCRFLSTWCNSYSDFEKGDCKPEKSTVAEMGLYAKKIKGVPIKSKFFLRTNDDEPFCNQNSIYLMDNGNSKNDENSLNEEN